MFAKDCGIVLFRPFRAWITDDISPSLALAGSLRLGYYISTPSGLVVKKYKIMMISSIPGNLVEEKLQFSCSDDNYFE